MNKYVSLFFAVLCGVLFFMYKLSQERISSLESEKNTLTANVNLLISEVKKRNEQAEELTRSNQELREAIKTDNSGYDWRANIANLEPVLALKRMHQNRGSVRTD